MSTPFIGINENYNLGDCTVIPSSRLIIVKDVKHKIQPRIMNLLCYLASRKGSVVTHDELIEHVWEGSIVSDVALQRGISLLRKCLGDDTKNPQYIKTIQRTGYKLIADVSVIKASKTKILKIKKEYFFSGIVLILIFSLLGYYLPSLNSLKKLVVVPKLRYLTSHDGLEYGPVISQDNVVIFSQYTQGWTGNYSINLRKNSEVTKLPISKDFTELVWSNDGSVIYSRTKTADTCHIVKHQLSGLPSLTVSDCITVNNGMFFYMDISPDDTQLVVSERSKNIPRKLYTIGIESGKRQPLFNSIEGIGDYAPKYSPNGEWIAFTRGFSASSRELMVVAVNGGETKQITHDNAFIQDLAWTTDNKIVFISNRDSGQNGLWLTNTNTPNPLWLNIIIDGINRIDISHDDQLLVYQDWYQPFNLFQFNALEGEIDIQSKKSLTSTRKENYFPAQSPDGKLLAYVSNKTGNHSLWISQSDGTQAKLLIENVHKYSAPEWSANSQQIVYSGLFNGQGDICITNLTGQFSCITHSNVDELFPTWSQDQNSIYFTHMPDDDKNEFINFKHNLISGETIQSELGSALNVRATKNPNILYFNEAVSSNIFKFNTQTHKKELIIDDFYDIYYKSWFPIDNGIYYFNNEKHLVFRHFDKNKQDITVNTSKLGGYDTTSGMYYDDKNNILILSLSPLTLNGDIGIIDNFAEILHQN